MRRVAGKQDVTTSILSSSYHALVSVRTDQTSPAQVPVVAIVHMHVSVREDQW